MSLRVLPLELDSLKVFEMIDIGNSLIQICFQKSRAISYLILK